jgi:hypothetical protein
MPTDKKKHGAYTVSKCTHIRITQLPDWVLKAVNPGELASLERKYIPHLFSLPSEDVC